MRGEARQATREVPLSLLLQLAWLCVWLWLFAHGDEIARGLMAALLPWFVLVGLCITGTLVLLVFVVSRLCSKILADNTAMTGPHTTDSRLSVASSQTGDDSP